MAKIIFGVVSDTHLGSKAQRLDELCDFYRWVSRYTNKTYHAGDLTEGVGVYRGQEQDVFLHGVDDQIDYVIKEYPKGLEVRVISGNHDLRTWEKTGVDVVRKVCEARKDFRYLGRWKGEVTYPFGKVWIVHPSGGSFYSLSYGGQKYARNLDEKRKPKIIIFGHGHKKALFRDLGIEMILAGCFQGQNDFTIRRGLTPAIGGWLIEINYIGRTIKSIKSIWKEYA